MKKLDRRTFLGSAAATGSLATLAGSIGFPSPAITQGKPSKITIVSHRVHRATSVEGAGGDITSEWRARNGVELEWVTLDLNGIHDRAFREASLGSTEVGLSFVLNARAVPDAIRLFTPLDDFQAAEPIEDIGDISKGMIDTFSLGGTMYGIPFRQAVNAFHYNTALMDEVGMSAPPSSIEDFHEAARKLTFTSTRGDKVNGWGFQADNYSDHVRLARALGGDFIDENFVS